MDSTNYVISNEIQTTFMQQIIITVKFYLISFLCLIWCSLKSIISGLFVYRSRKAIQGQVALVTGAGNGLGRAIAIRLAKEKCHIAVVDINVEAAEKTVEDVKTFGVKAKAYKVDVSNYDDVLSLKDEIIEDLGYVTILINNAALLSATPSLTASRELIQRTIDVNVCSHFWTTKIFIGDMVTKRQGHIVAICSIMGLVPAKSTLYAVTKNALHNFMGCLKEELYGKQWHKMISTTCVYPFFIATRKEITDTISKNKAIVVSPSYAADIIVEAIRSEEEILSIPKGYFTAKRLFSMLPQEAIRNYRKIIFGKNNFI
ncbi:estradiol 17-beta-dehydrogenase 11 [Sergentomyia squamirostris]